MTVGVADVVRPGSAPPIIRRERAPTEHACPSLITDGEPSCQEWAPSGFAARAMSLDGLVLT